MVFAISVAQTVEHGNCNAKPHTTNMVQVVKWPNAATLHKCTKGSVYLYFYSKFVGVRKFFNTFAVEKMESKDITSANRHPQMQSLIHSQSTLCGVVRVGEDSLSDTHTHTHALPFLHCHIFLTKCSNTISMSTWWDRKCQSKKNHALPSLLLYISDV